MGWGQWWRKGIALLMVINSLCIGFDLSYLSFRSFYLRHIPVLTQLYDPIKGIQPHPATETYLETTHKAVDRLAQKGLEDPGTQALLGDLQQQSRELFEQDPFIAANKPQIFAQLSQRVTNYIDAKTPAAAFSLLWSPEYLTETGWQSSLQFFQRQIEPLLRINYLRRLDEYGQFIDRFWILDAGFILIFSLALILYYSQLNTRRADSALGDILLRRWYDWFLILPFLRWMRVIPTIVWLHQSRVIDLERILSQITREPAAYLADRVSMFALVRLVNQLKEAVDKGDIGTLLGDSNVSYQNVGEEDKLDVILDRLIQLTLFKVLPQVQPDLEQLLRHNLNRAVKTSDIYQQLQEIPGLQGLPDDVIDQMADQLVRSTYDLLSDSYSDQQGKQLLDQLSSELRRSLRRELQQEISQSTLRILLADLLEEVKVNYIQRSAKTDPEAVLTEADQLHHTASVATQPEDS